MELEMNTDYFEILQQLKEKIRISRVNASLTVNTELLKLYWEIGHAINEQIENQKWGSKVIDRLVADLRSEFSDMKGLSPRNLRYMRNFASAYPTFPILQPPAAKLQFVENESLIILQQAVAKLPWTYNCTLLDKTDDVEKRLFYARKAIEHGWSRNVLVHQIDSRLYEATGALSNNFSVSLPKYDSELATQIFKDPYQLDFIQLSQRAKEKDLEDALMANVINFLLALGDGFALLARQKTFELGSQEFRIDLLFYHTRLRRHIVIELKIGEFEPEFVSKMNLYLGVVDDRLKQEHDEPAIGLILCKTKNKVVAEYALRDTNKPIGISEYRIGELLPEGIKSELPTIEEIEQKMDEELKEQIGPTDSRLRKIKEKLSKLNNDVLQTHATPQLLQEILESSLIPLYQDIIEKMSVFTEDFHETFYKWTARNNDLKTFEALQNFWTESVALKGGSVGNINFTYSLNGLKKAGTETYNDSISIVFTIDEYWYSFRVINHNNHQPFLKKLYHQALTVQEIKMISEITVNKALDRIDFFLTEASNR